MTKQNEYIHSVPLEPPEIPIDEDCSSGVVPGDAILSVKCIARKADDSDAISDDGKRKVFVPELLSMTKVLFDKHKRTMYDFLKNCLHNGTLEDLVGSKILTTKINHNNCVFPNVEYWRIDRENFFADVAVELSLDLQFGAIRWNGYIVFWCSAEDEDSEITCTIESLEKELNRKEEGNAMLDRFLIPIVTNQRVDEIAEGVWDQFLSEALRDPSKRVAETLAKKMGLRIEFHPVYEHRDVDSIVFFKTDSLEIGEDRTETGKDGKEKHIKSKTSKPVIIPANTIVVNTNRVRRDYSSFHIYHECYHYSEHYLFFRLQEMDSNDLRQVRVKEVCVDKDAKVVNPIYFAEKQANRGAYGLMMPKTHMNELIIDKCQRAENYRHAGEKFETAGIALSRELHLPHFRIRSRMIQLGNVEARGALNYVDRELIQPFAFDRDAWREDRYTFVVDEATVYRLRRQNPGLDELMASGKYIYADGHVVKNTPRYVRREGEKLLLTDEALKRVDNCCLRFVRLYVQQNIGRYVYGRMYFDPELQKQNEFYLSDLVNQKQLSIPDAQYEYIKDFPATFKEAFERLMQKNGENQETMAEKFATTSKTLRGWLNDPDRFITADFIAIVALMWKLPGWISMLLLETAHIQLSIRDRRHRALRYILDAMWDQGKEAADKFLTSQELPALSY